MCIFFSDWKFQIKSETYKIEHEIRGEKGKPDVVFTSDKN